MPSLISVLSSHGSSRIAHALSKESRLRPNAIGTNASSGDNASVKLPASLNLLFGSAAPSFLQQHQQPQQQPQAPFQQQFHQQFPPQPTTVQQPPTPRAAESQYFSVKPAEHCGLHLIHGNGHDLRRRQQDATWNASDVSVPSTFPLADLILDYLEEEGCDEDISDTWIAADAQSFRAAFGHDRMMVNCAHNGTEGQFHGMATALAPLQPAQYGPHAARLGLKPAPRREDSNRRLSGDDSLERQMQSSAHSQLRMVQSLATTTTPVEAALYADVISAMTDARACHEEASQALGGSALNAAVAGRLRAMGYDAAVCTTQWDSSPSVPEGTYEYIDVLVTDVPSTDLSTVDPSTPELASPCSTLLASTSPAQPCAPPAFTATTSPIPAFSSATRVSPLPTSATSPPRTFQRFIVDLDFRAQFQIARPTREYTAVIESTPLIFVGRQERLARLVEVVSDAMRGALRAQGMHIAPWRRWEYLNAKWMSGSTRRVVGEGKVREGTETERVTGGEAVAAAAPAAAAASQCAAVTISNAAVSATSAATSQFAPVPAAPRAPAAPAAAAVRSARMPCLAPAATATAAATNTASHNWCVEAPQNPPAFDRKPHWPALTGGVAVENVHTLHWQQVQQQQQVQQCVPSNVDVVLFQGNLIPARSFAAARG